MEVITRKRHVLFIACFCVVLPLAAPFYGTSELSLSHLFSEHWTPTQDKIFWQLRVPRVLVSMLAGIALALSGLVFQSLFRNPLASPYTLGVSSGAAFGAALAFQLQLSGVLLGISFPSLFALLGALGTVAFIYALSRGTLGASPGGLLLAGIVVNFFFGSLVLVIQYVSDFTGVFRLTRWLMGGFDVVGYDGVYQALPFALLAIGTTFYFYRELDLLHLGDEAAQAKGVEVTRVRTWLIFLISLAVGGIVAFCGPIGFVGIMVPHICRLLVGHEHRVLVPTSLFFGGAFLVLCDTAARTIVSPYEIPVGVITALLGAPFFLFLLVYRAKSNIFW